MKRSEQDAKPVAKVASIVCVKGAHLQVIDAEVHVCMLVNSDDDGRCALVTLSLSDANALVNAVRAAVDVAHLAVVKETCRLAAEHGQKEGAK